MCGIFGCAFGGTYNLIKHDLSNRNLDKPVSLDYE